jgi:hypothetical protein
VENLISPKGLDGGFQEGSVLSFSYSRCFMAFVLFDMARYPSAADRQLYDKCAYHTPQDRLKLKKGTRLRRNSFVLLLKIDRIACLHEIQYCILARKFFLNMVDPFIQSGDLICAIYS